MPRNGGGDYYLPPGTEAAPDTTVDSARYNVFTADVEEELNRLIDSYVAAGGDLSGLEADIAALENNKVTKAGDTMTGHLTLPASPAAANAVRKDYVDTADALKVAKDGDTMTGHLSLPTSPAAANAVRKDYVDAADTAVTNAKVAKAGDQMTGQLTTAPSQSIAYGGSVGSIEVRSTGTGDAAISFHRPGGGFACNFGLGSDHNFYFGGWSYGGATHRLWSTRDFNYTPLNKAGDTMSGAFTCSSSIFTSANFHLSSGNGLYFEGGYTVRLYWDGSNIVSSAGFFAGGIKSGSGYACKQGTAGGYSNTFNYFWTNSVMQQWVDNVNTGNVSVTSDYRAKKNVLDLPSTWDTVKALHPIKFEYNDWTPPWHIPPPPEEGQPKAPSLFMADGVERWGFLAHELQDALIMDAATGYKDTTEEIQSPNPWTVIAALTKALQEAMARIEALEAR